MTASAAWASALAFGTMYASNGNFGGTCVGPYGGVSVFNAQKTANGWSMGHLSPYGVGGTDIENSPGAVNIHHRGTYSSFDTAIQYNQDSLDIDHRGRFLSFNGSISPSHQ